jgi:uncharacterized membrane protein YphA (DoxX/SURF4 family)
LTDFPARRSPGATVVALLTIRLFLGVGSTLAGAEKLLSPDWWIGDGLLKFLAAQHDEAMPFFRPLMQRVIAPTAALVAIAVMVTQLWCGIAIAIGRHLRLALSLGFVLNVMFILAGRVSPSAFYLAMQAVLFFAIVRHHDAGSTVPLRGVESPSDGRPISLTSPRRFPYREHQRFEQARRQQP